MPTFPRTADAEGGFPPLETGWYKLMVLDVHDKVDKNKQSYWAVQFEVKDRAPKQVWDNFRNSEEWLWKLRMFLEAIDPSLTEAEVDTETLKGQEVWAFIVPDGKWDRIKQYSTEESPDVASPPKQTDGDMPF